METAEEIRLKMAQLKLAALQTEYCNANWTYNAKLKALREELQNKNKKQTLLTSQLVTLKKSFQDHQLQVSTVLAQAAKLTKQSDLNAKDKKDSPKKSCNMIPQNPKSYTKGLFFRVNKQQPKKISISPSFTKASSVSSWRNKKEANEQTRKDFQRKAIEGLVKQNITLQSVGSEKTFQYPRKLEQLRQNDVCGSLTRIMQGKSSKVVVGATRQRNQVNMEK